jgi:hypothetical protein
MCGRVFVIAVIASLAVPSVAVEIAEVDASAQFALIRKRGVEDASDVTAASAVNAGAVETSKDTSRTPVPDAEGDEEEEEEDGWNGLSDQQKKDWTLLGWNASSWDGDEEPGPDADKLWAALTLAQKEAAISLGYDEASWDDTWRHLPDKDQKAWTVLGWTQEMWDAGETEPEPLDWDELSDAQKEAAISLGYNEETWN